MPRLVALLLVLVRCAAGVKVHGLFTDLNYDNPDEPCDGALCGWWEGKRVVTTDLSGMIHVLGIDNNNMVWAARGEQIAGANGLEKDFASKTTGVTKIVRLSVDFSVKDKKGGKMEATFMQISGIKWPDGNVWRPVPLGEIPALEVATEGIGEIDAEDNSAIFNGVWKTDSGELRFVTDRIGTRRGTGITMLGVTDPGWWGLCQYTYPEIISCKFSDLGRDNAAVGATSITFTKGGEWTRMQAVGVDAAPDGAHEEL